MEFKEVHKDDRRKISVINGMFDGDAEFSIIELKKGKAVGGCKHRNKEYYCIVKGTVFAIIGSDQLLIPQGNAGEIPRHTPHMFHAQKEDAIILEWGISEEEKMEDSKDMFMKSIVDGINAKNK